MPTELQWAARNSTAAWYWQDTAAREAGRSELAHAERLEPARLSWQRFLETHDIRWDTLSETLLPLSAEFDSLSALVRAVLPRLMPRERAKLQESEWINALRPWEQAYAASNPGIVEELQLRFGPIRELAESYLPGLLRMVERVANPLLIPERARVVVVPPYRGGYSRSFPVSNTILWEGLLVNVQPQLPEVLRLCWSVAQLNLEVPALVGELSRGAACAAGAWALIPLTLHAGSELELCRCDQGTVQLAAETWQPKPWNDLSFEQTSATVWKWWETYVAMRPDWPVALGALIALLDASRS